MIARQSSDVIDARLPPGLATLVLAVGLVYAVLESLILITFIPLVRSLIGQVDGDWTRFSALLWLGRQGTSFILATLCVLVVVKIACSLLRSYLTERVEGQTAHALRHRIMELTLASSIERSGGHDQADILTILSDSSWKVAAAMGHQLEVVSAIAVGLVLLVTMVLISPPLSVVAIVLLGITALAMRAATDAADRNGRAVVADNKALGARMLENINALQMIRIFGNERYELDRFSQTSGALTDRVLRLHLLWALPGALTEAAVVGVLSVLILAGTRLGIEVGALVSFLSILFRLQIPVRSLIENKLARDGLRGSIEDVRHFIDAARRPTIAAGKVRLSDPVEEIRFEDVWFRYADDAPWALQGVSFVIEAGRMTGIVGGSGAGKTTIMLLLFRFIDPTRGRVLVNGQPLIEFEVASWRSQLGLMAQEVHLLDASIADNIRYGRLDADRAELEQAGHVAGLDDVVSRLEAGYDSLVGNTGYRLSGGQRQRVALARVVLRNPSVLLLDEATNALDAEAEMHIKLALDSFGRGRTVVAIAHRLSSLSGADVIVVLDHGTVAEIGAPDVLLNQRGRFAELYELQAGEWPRQAS